MSWAPSHQLEVTPYAVGAAPDELTYGVSGHRCRRAGRSRLSRGVCWAFETVMVNYLTVSRVTASLGVA